MYLCEVNFRAYKFLQVGKRAIVHFALSPDFDTLHVGNKLTLTQSLRRAPDRALCGTKRDRREINIVIVKSLLVSAQVR